MYSTGGIFSTPFSSRGGRMSNNAISCAINRYIWALARFMPGQILNQYNQLLIYCLLHDARVNIYAPFSEAEGEVKWIPVGRLVYVQMSLRPEHKWLWVYFWVMGYCPVTSQVVFMNSTNSQFPRLNLPDVSHYPCILRNSGTIILVLLNGTPWNHRSYGIKP